MSINLQLLTLTIVHICFIYLFNLLLNYLFAGSGKLFDDIRRHGCQYVFWCYPFEREVSNVVSIPTNQLNNEVTYSEYFSRVLFTKHSKLSNLFKTV
jgi:hypothetical protein